MAAEPAALCETDLSARTRRRAREPRRLEDRRLDAELDLDRVA